MRGLQIVRTERTSIPQSNEDNTQYPTPIITNIEDSCHHSTLFRKERDVQSLHTNLSQSISAYKVQGRHRIYSKYQIRIQGG